MSNEEMYNSDLLVRGGTEINENETKKYRSGFLGKLLGTLGATLLRNMLVNKGVIRGGNRVNEADAGLFGSEKRLLISPLPLTYFETQESYQN